MLLSYLDDNLSTSAAILVNNGAFDIAQYVMKSSIRLANFAFILYISRRFYYLLFISLTIKFNIVDDDW